MNQPAPAALATADPSSAQAVGSITAPTPSQAATDPPAVAPVSALAATVEVPGAATVLAAPDKDLAVPALAPGEAAAADNRVAEGVQPSLSFAPGKANLGSGKAASADAGTQSMVAMFVALGFALSVAGLLVNDEFRRRKTRVRTRARSNSGQ